MKNNLKMNYLVQFVTIIFFIFPIHYDSYPQDNLFVDSLKGALSREENIEGKIDILIDISKYYGGLNDFKRSESYLFQAESLAQQGNDKKTLSIIYQNLGVLNRNIANYGKSLHYHQQSLFLAKQEKDTLLQTTSLNSIGVVYRRIDNYPKATEYHLLALKLSEEFGHNYNISVALNSLGNIYSLNGQYKEAFQYFERALELSKKMKNTLGEAINYNNIGEVYEFRGVLDSALNYYNLSLDANQRINSTKGIAISYNAIGKIYLFSGQPQIAHDFFSKALELDLSMGDKKFICDSYINLSRSSIELGNIVNAEKYAKRVVALATEIGSITHIQLAYEVLSQIYSVKRVFDKSLHFYQLAATYKDSLLNEKNTRTIATLEMIYEIDKNQKQIEMLEQEKEINDKELARQKTIRNFYLTGLVFTVVLVVIILFALNVMRKSKNRLEEKNVEIQKNNIRLSRQQHEIQQQKTNIQHQNRNLQNAYQVIEKYNSKITDSIKYAERIQSAILSSLEIAAPYFEDYFCYYKPKDYVSGDFYWLSTKNDKLIFAVADCTGHGVPGAFMSIIGMDLLNQAVNRQNIQNPSEILTFLNSELRNKLKREENEVFLKDSMDIAICTMSMSENVIHYSGALIPLVLVRGNRIFDYRPNFVSIGTSTETFNVSFKQQDINIEKGDWIYLYSDGIIDQFGGGKNKKFMRQQLWDSLVNINTMEGEKQREAINRIFLDWKQNVEQTDDIILLGLKY